MKLFSKICVYGVLLVGLVFIFGACSEDLNNETNVPASSVYYKLNVFAEAPQLLTPGNSVCITEKRTSIDRLGYGGLLIICNPNGGYYCYDLTCPYEVDSDIRVETNGGMIATCPDCGSTFSQLMYGSGRPDGNSLAIFALRSYTVQLSYSGRNPYLFISN